MTDKLSDIKCNDERPFDRIELIAIARIVNLIVSPDDSQITPLMAEIMGKTLRGLNVPHVEVEHLVATTLAISQDEALDIIRELSKEKKTGITNVIAQTFADIYMLLPFISQRNSFGGIVGDAERRFYRICETCGLPWKIVDEIMIAEHHSKWAYKIRNYYFDNRESAVQAGKFIETQEDIERKFLASLAEGHSCVDRRVLTPKECSSVVGMFVSQDCHILKSFDEFREEHNKRAFEEDIRWHNQPAFIANSTSALLDSMVERKRRYWGQ